jgi:pilus assembly protein CpaE
MGIRNLLLATDDLRTVNAVTAALQSNGKLSENAVCRGLTELSHRLQTAVSPVVLVDIDRDPETILRQLEPLVRQHADAKFLVLAHELRHDLMLEAMQVGARHFMLKRSIAGELAAVLRRICPDDNSESQGRAVTVLSASGGCGATTVAVNVASELNLAAGENDGGPVLVADLDTAYGAVASYLGVDGEYGLVDLLSRPGSIDPQLIISTVQAHSNQIHALLSTSARRLGEGVAFDPHRLAHAADACRGAYSWTVFDAPRLTMPAAAELAKRSAATLLLFQMTIKDLHIVRRMRDGLEHNGVARNDITLVANRYRKRATMIRMEEVRQGLGLSEADEIKTLANDFYATTEAVNFGKPLSQAAPRSDFRRDIQSLVNAIKFNGRRDDVSRRLVGVAVA